MSYSPSQLLKITANYEKIAEKKLDPKAKVRNRGTVCVPAESAKDKKDHFPINDEGQARNALARVQQLSSSPEWYKGSLEGLKSLVSRKVHSKYPSIKSEKKKSSYEVSQTLINKYAQDTWNSTEQTDEDAKRFMAGGPAAGPAGANVYQGKGTGAGLNRGGLMEVQKFLKGKGYDLGNFGPNKDGIDGKMGPKTQQALRDYQQKNGLPVTGVDDTATWKAIQSERGGLMKDMPGNDSLSPIRQQVQTYTPLVQQLSKMDMSKLNQQTAGNLITQLTQGAMQMNGALQKLQQFQTNPQTNTEQKTEAQQLQFQASQLMSSMQQWMQGLQPMARGQGQPGAGPAKTQLPPPSPATASQRIDRLIKKYGG